MPKEKIENNSNYKSGINININAGKSDFQHNNIGNTMVGSVENKKSFQILSFAKENPGISVSIVVLILILICGFVYMAVTNKFSKIGPVEFRDQNLSSAVNLEPKKTKEQLIEEEKLWEKQYFERRNAARAEHEKQVKSMPQSVDVLINAKKSSVDINNNSFSSQTGVNLDIQADDYKFNDNTINAASYIGLEVVASASEVNKNTITLDSIPKKTGLEKKKK